MNLLKDKVYTIRLLSSCLLGKPYSPQPPTLELVSDKALSSEAKSFDYDAWPSLVNPSNRAFDTTLTTKRPVNGFMVHILSRILIGYGYMA